MLKWLRQLYAESEEVYKERLHRIVALLFLPLGLLLAYNNFMINSQQDPGCLTACVADYSLVGVWLIIVPITMLALAVYYLDMKPTMLRKKNER